MQILYHGKPNVTNVLFRQSLLSIKHITISPIIMDYCHVDYFVTIASQICRRIDKTNRLTRDFLY